MNRTLEDNPVLKEVFNQVVYPNGVMQRIEGGIDGNGFFPGASGIIDQDKRLSDCEYLVLGQDQDTLAGYNKSCEKGNERYTPTWRNMKILFAGKSKLDYNRVKVIKAGLEQLDGVEVIELKIKKGKSENLKKLKQLKYLIPIRSIPVSLNFSRMNF